MIGCAAGRLASEWAGSVSTRMRAKPGKKSLIGWSSRSLPASTSCIAASAVTGLVIE